MLVPNYLDADLARTLETILKPRPRPSLALGTQITCFTGTKIQILTQKRCAASGWWARTFRHRACEKSARRFGCPRRRSSSSTWKKGKKKLQRARFPPASACCCGGGRDDGGTPQVPRVCVVCVVEYYMCLYIYIYIYILYR